MLALAEADKALALGAADAAPIWCVVGYVCNAAICSGPSPIWSRPRQLSSAKDAQVLHWLAAAQFQSGQRNKALLTQRQAVELRPRDEEMLAQLREFELELTKDLK